MNGDLNSFALIGAAGYIAPKHMAAIKETNNILVAALDKNDSVGIIDSYFPDAAFFTEFERFDRHLEKVKRNNKSVDFLSICSPNYLHDAHIRFGLRYGSNVICEKPTVLNPWNVDALQEIEKETGKTIYNILQLRLHKNIVALKSQVENSTSDKVFDIDLTYITSRGNWYYTSWKGDENKSGGIATNIGVHFFDMLSWIFGDVTENKIHIHEHDRAAGYLEFKNARVRWFLSINNETLPQNIKENGGRTFRSISIDGNEIEFSNGFSDLHTKSYEAILNNEGFSLNESRRAIELIHDIRHKSPIGLKGEFHPYCKFPTVNHPFNSKSL